MIEVRRRFNEIDLLRFLAAFFVLLFHYTFRGGVADKMCDISFPSLGTFFKYGYLGVDLFFLISGFVILLTAYNRDAISYCISRIVRLYPAFWVCVSLTALVTLFLGADRFHVRLSAYLVNLTMMNRFVGVEHVDNVYWSLVIELKFYFLILMVLIFRQMRSIKYILGLWLAFSVFLLGSGRLEVLHSIFIPEWSHYFIAGAFFFLINKEGCCWYKLLLIGASYVTSLIAAMSKSIEYAAQYGVQFEFNYIFLIVTFFYLIFFLIIFNKINVLRNVDFAVVGAATYPLYLLHQNIGFMLFNFFGSFVEKKLLFLGIVSLLLLTAHKYQPLPY